MEYSPNFPKTLEAFKQFVKDHLFNEDEIDDEICASIIEKINKGDCSFTKSEIDVMRAISNIGDVCTCDTDHRKADDRKAWAVSKT